jgi:hypothetical protein
VNVGGGSDQLSQCSHKGPSEWKGLCLVGELVHGSSGRLRAYVGERGGS